MKKAPLGDIINVCRKLLGLPGRAQRVFYGWGIIER